jgi:glutamate-ammonia-ligase adenylyltransferase
VSEQQPAFDALPEALRDPAARAWDACVAAGFDARALADPAVAQALPRVFACSRFVATSCARAPGLLADLTTSGELGRPRAPGELKARIGQALAGAETEAELMRVLRLERRRELVRIAWRDLAGASDLAESLAELSELAEVCIDAALERVQAALIARHGEPEPVDGAPQRLIVLAMGKLGGRELNFSSDVDLVFLFPEPGQTDGPRPLSNAELFTRVAQRLIHVLSAPTADGFVVRVDARLRPFGESGALVLHLRGLETYLQEHGREWERYAYVKARPLSGSAPHVAELDALLRPFVYRRYLDFGVFQALRDMRNLILREVERRDLRDDVKLGPGGIREAEFVVQAIQLLRGGRDPGLQTTEFARALARIRERRYLEAAAADALADAYRYLRHAENRLQAYADEQTHALPRDEAGLARLALAMGEPDAAAFRAALARHRVAVGAQFASVVLGPGREAGSTVAPLAGAWEGSGASASGTRTRC